MVTFRESAPYFVVTMISVGVSVGVSMWLSQSPPTESSRSASRAVADRLDVLEQRLGRLEREAPVQRAQVQPSRQPERSPIDKSNEVLTIAALEKRLAALEGSMRAAAPVSQDMPELPHALTKTDATDHPMSSREKGLARHAIIAKAEHTITDPNTSVQDKVDAHSLLRRVDAAYTPAMAKEMIRIGLRDPDPTRRARVWTMFDGSSAASLPELVPSLLEVLARDVSGHARCEASETLGNFPDDPAAIAALEFAAQHDKDPNVRRRAARTLDEIRSERDSGPGRR